MRCEVALKVVVVQILLRHKMIYFSHRVNGTLFAHEITILARTQIIVSQKCFVPSY